MNKLDWSSVNEQLNLFGLPTVDIVFIGNISPPTVLLSAESSQRLCETLKKLMKDVNTRQQLIHDTINISNRLREELKAQNLVSQRYQGQIQELHADLHETCELLQFFLKEHEASFSLSLPVPESKKTTVEMTVDYQRLLQLHKKYDQYERKIKQLSMKLGSRSEQRNKNSSNEMDSSNSHMKTARRVNEFFRLKENSGEEHRGGDGDAPESFSSSDSENSTVLKWKMESFERDLNETKQKMKMLEAENRKLKSEMLNNSNFGKNEETKLYSTKVEDLPDLPGHVCRNYLKNFCEQIEVANLNLISPKLVQMKKAHDEFLHLEQFTSDVMNMIDQSGISLPPGFLKGQDLTSSKSQHPWSRKTWCVLSSLDYWTAQLTQLRELQISVKNLAERMFPWKPVKLEDEVTVGQLIKLVNSLTFGDECDITGKVCNDRFCVEPVSKETLEGMIHHFQMLFDVPCVDGVYARMSNIYRRLGETHSIMRNLKEFLGLDESAKSNAVVDAVASLCEARERQIGDFLASMFQTDDIHSIVRKIEVQDELLSTYENIINHLMSLLNVQSLDKIIPAVSRFVHINSNSV